MMIWALAVLAVTPTAPAVAFHYGAEPPQASLSVFDYVILDASVRPTMALSPARPLAYVALAEVHPSSPWAAHVEEDWVLGRNPAWGGAITDMAHPGWRRFLLDVVLPDLAEAGFRGFFFDAVDSHLMAVSNPRDQQLRWAGLVNFVTEVRAKFPGLTLFINRGFEKLEALAPLVDGVVAESLFGGWDPTNKVYVDVSPEDRKWLQAQLETAKALGCLTIVVDYRAPEAKEKARRDAKAIYDQGHIPWVTGPELSRLGVGTYEVLPREVWLLYDSLASELHFSSAHRFLAAPLEYLGLVPRYVDVRQPLPVVPEGELAGIVTWLESGPPLPSVSEYRAFLQRARRSGVPLVFFETLNEALDASFLEELGVRRGPPVIPRDPVISVKSPLLGFEAAPRPVVYEMLPTWTEGPGFEPLLELREGASRLQAILLAPWGGWALRPHFMAESYGGEGRWVVNPFEFLRRALRLGDGPVVDSTTESGRRILLAHIDGDGAASLTDQPGRPPAITVIRRWLERQYFPHSVSVVEGEVAQYGLAPRLSPRLEREARRIFALPHVEPASHGYSHPFVWSEFERGKGGALDLPSGAPDLRREVLGSLAYVERLAGVPPELFFWTGDALPGPRTLNLLDEAGVLNINGGFTVITDARPSVTHVSPATRPVGDRLQIYAPILNENVFTNGWTGPFWGYRRVIETFERTGFPRRLKPLGIYYHFFSATRRAGRKALDRVYKDALRRRPLPLYLSDWIRDLTASHDAVSARHLDGHFRLRRASGVRTLRLPRGAKVDVASSVGVAGQRSTRVGHYVNLWGQAEVDLKMGSSSRSGPEVVHASGRISDVLRSPGLFQVDLVGKPPFEIVLTAPRCRGRRGRPNQEGFRYLLRTTSRLVCRFGDQK